MSGSPWPGYRPAWVEVDLDAIGANVQTLAAEVAPARICAVVKAQAYGHGAVPVARAATAAGASWLAVALVEEALELRAAAWGATVLLKGNDTVIAAPDGRLAVNPTGVPALASGGTGDVLTGLTGALLAQGLDPFDAGRLGAWVHGRAGALAVGDLGPVSVSAGTVADHLPAAFRELLEHREGGR